MKISRADFTVFDVETTGLDAEEDFIIELGLAHFSKGELAGHSGEIVNPWPGERLACHIYVTEEIEQLTSITKDDVMKARDIGCVLNETRALVTKDFNVAYNAPFDLKSLDTTLRRHSREHVAGLLQQSFTVDPLVWIRQKDKYLKGAGKYKLTSACLRYGVTLSDAHRAYADAEATGRLLLELVKRKIIPDDLSEVQERQEPMREQQDREFQEYISKKRASE